jgi:hypothetical protein
MNSKQSISVLLMLGLLAPLTACGGGEEAGDGVPSPTVSETPSATKSPTPAPSASPKEEGGEGGEGQ